MSRTKRSYRIIPLELKNKIVGLRLSGQRSLDSICKEYGLSPENVIKWTRRYIAGLPLEFKRGKKSLIRSTTPPQDNLNELDTLKKENERLRATVAYQDELLKYLEKQGVVKKNGNS